MRTSTIFLFLFLASFAHADRTLDAAVTRLSNVPVFAFGGVGIVGSISQGEKDFMLLISQPPAVAEEVFRRILQSGNAQGKCYALVALRVLHPDQLVSLPEPVRPSDRMVLTQRGCIMSTEPLSKVVQHIDDWVSSVKFLPELTMPQLAKVAN